MLCGVPKSAGQRSLMSIPWRNRCRKSPIEKYCLRSSFRPRSRRLYSSQSHDGDQQNNFDAYSTLYVPAGGTGFVEIDLFNDYLLSNPSTPLVIYLPPTGEHLSKQHPPIPSYLLTPQSTLARVNYRWNITPPSSSKLDESSPPPPSYPFPLPIHDTLLAYSHLVSRFSPSPLPPPSSKGRKLHISPPSPTPKHIPRPILIYGSFIGGSVATSLALTESFSSKQHPAHISGLISKSGVYDWVEAGTRSLISQPVKYESDISIKGSWSIDSLIDLRESLFPNPGSCFDPFASPTLFFRTAGIPIPKSWSDLSSTSIQCEKRYLTILPDAEPEPSPLSSEVSIWDDYDDSNPDFLNTEKPNGRKREINLDPVSRRSHLKFPTKDSGLQIPRSLFLFNSSRKGRGRKEGDEGKQAEDMATLMRRSIIQHEMKDRVPWDDHLDAKEVAWERVRTCPLPTPGSGEEVTEEQIVRDWIKETLK